MPGDNLKVELHHGALPMELLLLADETEEAINKYIGKSEIYLASADERILGVCAVQNLSGSQAEIKNLAIAEAYQGKGYGKKFIGQILETYKDQGFESMLVGTGDASVFQLLFYLKCGFRFYEIRKDFFINNYPEPVWENGVQMRDMIVLDKKL